MSSERPNSDAGEVTDDSDSVTPSDPQTKAPVADATDEPQQSVPKTSGTGESAHESNGKELHASVTEPEEKGIASPRINAFETAPEQQSGFRWLLRTSVNAAAVVSVAALILFLIGIAQRTGWVTADGFMGDRDPSAKVNTANATKRDAMGRYGLN